MLEIELKQVTIIELIVLVVLSVMSFRSDFPAPLIALFSLGFLFRFFLYWFLSEEENVKK